MTTFILYIWIATAAAGTQYHPIEVKYSWVYGGEYASEKHCQNVIRKLNLKPETARCVATGLIK